MKSILQKCIIISDKEEDLEKTKMITLDKEYIHWYYYDIKARKNIGGQMRKMTRTVGVVREREREREQ